MAGFAPAAEFVVVVAAPSAEAEAVAVAAAAVGAWTEVQSWVHSDRGALVL